MLKHFATLSKMFKRFYIIILMVQCMSIVQYCWKDYNYRYVFTIGRTRKYIITLWFRFLGFDYSHIEIIGTIADDQSNYPRKLYSSYVMI